MGSNHLGVQLPTRGYKRCQPQEPFRKRKNNWMDLNLSGISSMQKQVMFELQSDPTPGMVSTQGSLTRLKWKLWVQWPSQVAPGSSVFLVYVVRLPPGLGKMSSIGGNLEDARNSEWWAFSPTIKTALPWLPLILCGFWFILTTIILSRSVSLL